MRRFLLAGTIVLVFLGAGCASQADLDTAQEQVALLEVQLADAESEAAALLAERPEIMRRLESYQQSTAYQKELAESLRLELGESIGDRLVMTEALYVELPKTLAEAEALGYSLLDTVTAEGELVEAACFAHEEVRHYGKLDPQVTSGVEWHGAPFLLTYSSTSGNLLGLVLESTSSQSSPPWEYHAGGHPSMPFEHWSMHIWFVDPPENLSLMGS